MNLKVTLLLWAFMVAIAIANGFFGEFVVSKVIGDYGAHLYKTFLIIAVIFIFSRLYIAKAGWGDAWFTHALSTGLVWLSMSITFEFIAGHYVFGFPWERLTADYRIWEGRLWSLVLASEVAAPIINAYLIYGR